MKYHACSRRGDGFTLLELLVAVAVLGISMTLVYGIYNSVFSVIGNVDRAASFQNRAGIVFDQLQRDLFGIYKGRTGFFKADERFAAESGEPLLQFTSSSHLTFNPAVLPEGMSVVSYFLLRSGNNDRFSLYRSEIPFKLIYESSADMKLIPLVVCENIIEFKLAYKDRYGTILEQWQARSASVQAEPDDDRFPSLVSVELVLAGDAGEESSTKRFNTLITLPPSQLIRNGLHGEG